MKNEDKNWDDSKESNKNIVDSEALDPAVNKDFDRKPDSKESLTNDEDADTDPNEVDDKPSFTNDNQ